MCVLDMHPVGCCRLLPPPPDAPRLVRLLLEVLLLVLVWPVDGDSARSKGDRQK